VDLGWGVPLDVASPLPRRAWADLLLVSQALCVVLVDQPLA